MADAAPMPVNVRPIPSEDTRPLRWQVLRPSQPPDTLVYPGDDDEGTVHFGAYLGDRLVGIASLYAESRSGVERAGPGWRLRGMASTPEARGRGIGRALMTACTEHVASHGGGELWCNARIPAVGFYARWGLEVVSEPFEIEGIGPHVVMRRLIPAAG